MENYSYTSYPESGDSSPRSREIEFENPSPWEDQQPSPNCKVKFMCSYGGKIHPRPHDNLLSYIGGETKILAVDRNIKFAGFIAKLSALCDADVCFKYQLPGEDLDALISVTNDDDLEHMMHEYDRLCRASAKPARLRLFLFTVHPPAVAAPSQGFGSTEGKSEKDRFVDALNSGPIHAPPPPSTVAPPANVDLLFGFEKGMPPPAVGTKVRDPTTGSPLQEPEIPVPGVDDRVAGSDPIQKHIQDLQRLRIGEEQQAMYRRQSEDNLLGGYTGDYYVQKMPEQMPPATLPGTVPAPGGYWPEKQVTGGAFPASTLGAEQPVYMMPAHAGMYHAPMVRQVTGPSGQGYYAVQRMPPEVYRDQQVYSVGPPMGAVATPAAAAPTLPPQAPPKMAAYSEGMGMVRTTGGMGMADTGYAQVGYDGAMGRQMYYTAQGGVMAAPPPQGGSPYQPMAADMRAAGALNQEVVGKAVAAKVSQTSM